MSVDLHRHQFSEHETQKVHVFEDEPVLFDEITAAPTRTLLFALFDLFFLGRPENYQPDLAEFRG